MRNSKCQKGDSGFDSRRLHGSNESESKENLAGGSNATPEIAKSLPNTPVSVGVEQLNDAERLCGVPTRVGSVTDGLLVVVPDAVQASSGDDSFGGIRSRRVLPSRVPERVALVDSRDARVTVRVGAPPRSISIEEDCAKVRCDVVPEEVVLCFWWRFPDLNEVVKSAHMVRGSRTSYERIKRELTDQVALVTRSQVPAAVRDLVRTHGARGVFGFVWHEDNRHRDPDNISAAQKFVFDGLVVAGLLRGDGWEQVESIHHEFEVLPRCSTKVAGVTLTISFPGGDL